ncbi:MAG TPA: long-chain fatty acid--CoA ligase [Armatimonadota bacterium]|nr:long-chain fatty acid--CoA ligase [Armatimonadota bacterium]
MSTTSTTAVSGQTLSMPPAAECGEGAQTVGRMLLHSSSRFSEEVAIRYKLKGEYRSILYRELYARALSMARGFLAIGIEPGNRVAILSENRPEWGFVDLACQLLGVSDVPIYPSLPSVQVEYILNDAGARAIVVSDAAQLKKITEAWPRLKSLETAVVMDGKTSDDERVQGLDEMVRRGEESDFDETKVRELCERVAPDDLASVVYTSGTTGDPKGAMLTHQNFMSNVNSVVKILQVHPNDVFLSFLPLNHVFERLGGYYLPIRTGATIVYAESALRVKQNLPEVRPTVMIGVPRLYDGLKDGVLTTLAKAPEKQQKLFRWATAVGAKRAQALEAGRSPGIVTALEWAAADRLVLRRVREKIGADRLRYLVSGSAPLPRATADFLLSIGIPFLEGYGLTETSPVVSVNRPEHFRVGSVGTAIPGAEIKIAEDGEILCRGPNIMKGYLNKPEATAEAIDADGWFHTGDVGRLDDQGFLYITDRKKDLIVLATGKKVAPQPIEGRLKASPLIREVVVLGDRMSSCVALVLPAMDRLAEEARKQGWKFENDPELCALPEAKKLIRQEIDRLSGDLAEYERIRNVALIDREFTVESGELTPSLKVRRKVVMENYADVIKGLG